MGNHQHCAASQEKSLSDHDTQGGKEEQPMTVQLNSEQLDWLMTLTRSEARLLIRTLATGE